MNDNELNDKMTVLIRDMDDIGQALRKRGQDHVSDALDRAAILLETHQIFWAP